MNQTEGNSIRKSSDRRLMAWSLFWTFAGDLGSKAAVLVTTFIAVRALSPVEFGQYVGLSAVSLLAGALWDLGSSVLLTREISAGRLCERSALVQIISLRLRTSGLWVIVFLIGVVTLTRGQATPFAAIIGFVGASLFFSASAVPIAMLRARHHFRLASAAQAAGRWMTALVSLLAVLLLDHSLAFEILAMALLTGELAVLVVAAAGAYRLRRRAVPEPSAPQIRLRLRAALPFAANGLLATAYNRLDVIIVAALSSVDQAGAYAPASRIQDALYVIPSTIGMVAFPLIARLHNDHGGQVHANKLVSEFIAVGLAVSVPTAIVVTLFAPDIIRVVLGSDYASAITPTRILIWFLPLAVIQAPVIAALGASDRAADTTKVFTATFLVALGMHLSLDWRWGASGAAIASLTRDIAAIPIVIFFARRAGLRFTSARFLPATIPAGHRIGRRGRMAGPIPPLFTGPAGRLAVPLAAALILFIAAGASIALNGFVVIAIAIIALGTLLLISSQFRSVVVIFGGLITLQSSQEFNLMKIAYLLAVALALVAIVFRLKDLERGRVFQMMLPLTRASLGFLAIIALSLVVAKSQGTTLTSWVRDAAPYILFAAVPILAVDASTVMNDRYASSSFILAGILSAISFSLEWLDRRGITQIELSHLVLPSFMLPAAIFSYAISSAFLGNVRRTTWAMVAIVIAAFLLVTGTRSSLVLIVPVLVAVLWQHGSLFHRYTRVAIYAIFTLAILVTTTQALTALTGVELDVITDRYLSVIQVFQDPTSDESYDDRLNQTRAAWSAFTADPWLGTGPGRLFQWSASWRQFEESFSIDTPAAILAKFGIIGLLGFIWVAIGFMEFWRQIPNDRNLIAPKVALMSYGIMLLAWLPLGSPFEDKGLSFGLYFLITGCLIRSGQSKTTGWERLLRPSVPKSRLSVAGPDGM